MVALFCFFQFQFKKHLVLQAFYGASIHSSNAQFCVEAALYLVYLEIGFLPGPKSCCSCHLSGCSVNDRTFQCQKCGVLCFWPQVRKQTWNSLVSHVRSFNSVLTIARKSLSLWRPHSHGCSSTEIFNRLHLHDFLSSQCQEWCAAQRTTKARLTSVPKYAL